jgi:Uncharacterized protein involved in tellurite resistance
MNIQLPALHNNSSEEEEALTPDEYQRLILYKSKIKPQQPDNNWGAATRHRIASLSEELLNKIKDSGLQASENVLSQLLKALKKFNRMIWKKKFYRFIPRFGKKQIAKIMEEHPKIAYQISQMEIGLEKQYRLLLKNNLLFDKLYEQNKENYRELSLYIRAGEEVEKEQKDLPQQAALLLKKRIGDLKTSRLISFQLASQIRLIQYNNSLLSEKLCTALEKTLPLWRNQIGLSLGMYSQGKSMNLRPVDFSIIRQLDKDLKSFHSGLKQIKKQSESEK